jgi:short-chain fatty acids transporter
MLDKSGLAAQMSRGFQDVAGRSEAGLAVSTFLSAGLVNVFVPSGGGQWAVQGRVALQAAVDSGASPAKMVMAVAYGDQWTNMVQFFWALPLAGITGVRVQDALGYTAVTLLVTGPVFAAALAVF